MTRGRQVGAGRSTPEGAPADRRQGCVLALALALASTPAAAQLVLGGNHRIFQNNAGGTVDAGDHFGAAFAAGDFNRDGYSDLAIGAPDETVGSAFGAGSVYVVYGSASGLGAGPTGPLVLHQDATGVQDTAESGDRFGAALAALDVNGDGWDDLAVGIPSEDVDLGGGVSVPNAGAIQVFLGSVGGIVAAADTYIDGTDTDQTTYYATWDDNFGFALVGCDDNHDGREDLMVSAPGDPSGGVHNARGGVLRFPATAGGITTVGVSAWYRGEVQSRFGAAVDCRQSVAGAVLLVGEPGYSAEGFTPDAGATWAFPIGAGGEVAFELATAGARYGSAVALGDFRGVGVVDALGGAPGWSFPGPIGEGGLAWVRYLSNPAAGAAFTQDTAGVADDTEGFDHLGAALAVADFDRDGYDDAVIGVPEENFNDGTPQLRLDVGVVHVLFGGSGGLSGSGSQFWSWDVIGFEFAAVAHDRFGSALAAGDFDGNGVDDLAIGAPGAEWSGQADTGIVQILYAWPDGWIFGDDFEGGNTQKWSL